MLTGEGRVIVQRDADRPTKVLVYVPLDVARDSQFPFQESTAVNVSLVDGDRLIIEAK